MRRNINFYTEFVDEIAEILNESDLNLMVETEEVVKPDHKYYGISVSVDEHIGMCYDLNLQFREFQDGRPIDDIVESLQDHIKEQIVEYRRNPLLNTQNISELLSDYNFIKERLYIEAVNATRNDAFLNEAPCQINGDVACIYRVILASDDEREQSFAIKDKHMDAWNISLDELHHDAVMNSQKIREINIIDLQDYGLPSAPFKVCTNENKKDGAGVIFYEDFYDKLMDAGIEECYIIPSSVHEVLLYPTNRSWDIKDLTDILTQVNSQCVDEEEVLADHIFKCDAKNRELIPLDRNGKVMKMDDNEISIC